MPFLGDDRSGRRLLGAVQPEVRVDGKGRPQTSPSGAAMVGGPARPVCSGGVLSQPPGAVHPGWQLPCLAEARAVHGPQGGEHRPAESTGARPEGAPLSDGARSSEG